MLSQKEIETCDHCEKEILDDGSDRLTRVPGYDDRVCSACLVVSALAPEGEEPKCSLHRKGAA